MTTHPVDLDALDAMDGRATPGPWLTIGSMLTNDPRSRYGLITVTTDEEAWFDEPVDAEFVAALRNAYPALRDELRALRDEVKHLRYTAELAADLLAKRDAEESRLRAEVAQEAQK